MIEIDLLPRSSGQGGRRASSTPVPRRPLRFLVQDPWVLASAGVFVLCAVLSGWLMVGGRAGAAELDAALTAAVLDSARAGARAREERTLAARLDSARVRVAAIRELDARRYIWPRLLDGLAKALPPEAWLVQVAQLSSGNGIVRFRVEGKTFDNSTLARFWEGMESSEFIHDVRLVGTEHLLEPTVDGGEPRSAHFFVIEADYRDSRAQLLGSAVPPGRDE